jgi:hypothetical protein
MHMSFALGKGSSLFKDIGDSQSWESNRCIGSKFSRVNTLGCQCCSRTLTLIQLGHMRLLGFKIEASSDSSAASIGILLLNRHSIILPGQLDGNPRSH